MDDFQIECAERPEELEPEGGALETAGLFLVCGAVSAYAVWLFHSAVVHPWLTLWLCAWAWMFLAYRSSRRHG